jgi:3-oxoacyl-[acyl-carrier protein] reductase
MSAARVVIITGGGSGIGQAMCQAFAQAGDRVVVANRTGSKAEAVAAAIMQQGGEALPVTVDVSRSADVQQMVETVLSRYGRVDVLINSAGISPSGSVTEISEAEWDACLDIDLKSIFLTAKYTIPIMQRHAGGVILNVAGTFGIRAARGKAAYSTAKAGAINLTRAIALDYARDGIRCNAICPGFVETPLTATDDLAGRDAFLAAYQPLSGLIQPEEAAALALYLASDAAKMITGQVFVIDGGQQAGLFVG